MPAVQHEAERGRERGGRGSRLDRAAPSSGENCKLPPSAPTKPSPRHPPAPVLQVDILSFLSQIIIQNTALGEAVAFKSENLAVP